MSKEYYWGDCLTDAKKVIKWNPSLDDEDDFDNLDSNGIQHILFLKQAVLGLNAKEGVRNVVEMEANNFDGDIVKQPLFSLKLDLNESCPLDIGVQPPVTFTLINGSGPVYLSGQHMIEIFSDEDGEEEEEEEEDVEVSASPDLPAIKSKKRPLSTSEGATKKSKMAKLDKDTGKDEEAEDEDEDENDAEMAEMDDEEDDEDDEDFEGEDDEEDEEDESEEEDDEEEDEEEEEEEDDEESPEKPVKKKAASKKGQVNGTATAKGDGKAAAKTATKQTKVKGKKKMLGLDEIKLKIQESTSVPKKEEKFKNYLRSAFHISEAKKLQDLWGWYRVSLQK